MAADRLAHPNRPLTPVDKAIVGIFAAAGAATGVDEAGGAVAALGRAALRFFTQKFIKPGAQKGLDKIFSNGRTPKASELKKYAEGHGWKPTQTKRGPLKYVDENGIPRVTIKRGSPRAPGSGSPHVELKDASGKRVDPSGSPVTQHSPGNHTPINYDLRD